MRLRPLVTAAVVSLLAACARASGNLSAGSSSGSGGGSQATSTGSGGRCTTDADCADGNPCTTPTCDTTTGGCAHAPIPDGPPPNAPPAGYCLLPTCVGGVLTAIADDTEQYEPVLCIVTLCSTGTPMMYELPSGDPCGMGLQCDDGGECFGCKNDGDCQATCQVATCMGSGECMNDGVPPGTPCTAGGGRVCDALGACVACVSDGDCPGGPPAICARGACLPSCTDGAVDGTETDVDCGGACPPCAVDHTCNVDADCASHVCAKTNHTCL
jgi:hypothetical protein